MRFCIESQQIFIFDASRSNIVKADATSLKPNTTYRLAVGILSPSNGGNWGVTVSNIRAFKDRSGIDKFWTGKNQPYLSLSFPKQSYSLERFIPRNYHFIVCCLSQNLFNCLFFQIELLICLRFRFNCSNNQSNKQQTYGCGRVS